MDGKVAVGESPVGSWRVCVVVRMLWWDCALEYFGGREWVDLCILIVADGCSRGVRVQWEKPKGDVTIMREEELAEPEQSSGPSTGMNNQLYTRDKCVTSMYLDLNK